MISIANSGEKTIRVWSMFTMGHRRMANDLGPGQSINVDCKALTVEFSGSASPMDPMTDPPKLEVKAADE